MRLTEALEYYYSRTATSALVKKFTHFTVTFQDEKIKEELQKSRKPTRVGKKLKKLNKVRDMFDDD